MSATGQVYEQLHADHRWAYGTQADPELMQAIGALPKGRVLDLGGGQGRHALALAAAGFEVQVVDGSQTALSQLRRTALEAGVDIGTVRANMAFYRPSGTFELVVGALVFHLPARHAGLAAARAAGEALTEGGGFYLSVPGFNEGTRRLAEEVLQAAGCAPQWCVNHVVTRAERPRLPVPRRNETRALGIRQ